MTETHCIDLEAAERIAAQVSADTKPSEGDYFRASDLDGKAIPERLELVPGLIPASNISILGGDGGTGKSTLGLQLCSATSLDRKFLGRHVMPGNALYLSAEDDRDEIHRRLAAIAASENVGLGEMHRLTIRCLAGEDALLAVPSLSSGGLSETPLFKEVEETVSRLQPVVIVLDSLADIYGGNENDRAQVRQFAGMLRGLALRHRCAVVMLAHPSLSGLTSGSGSSGSTAWNNSVRSRLYFSREKRGGLGENNDPDLRTLEVMKANYSPIGECIRVRWRDGVFVADSETRMDFISRAAAQNKADEMFLHLLHRMTVQGRMVSDSPGRNYAPAAFAVQPDNGNITKEGFTAAMNRLFAEGRIRVEMDGPPSKQRRYLVVVEMAK